MADMAVMQSRARRKIMARSYMASYLMILPAILFLLVFTIYPMGKLIQLSLWKGNAANAYKSFQGIENYRQLLMVRREFKNALVNTAVYTVWIVFLLISLSVVFAVWMQDNRKINNLAQSAFFVPHLVASVSCAFIFSWIFSADTSGIMNSFLKLFGAPARNIGYYALIILSALKAIPAEIYEAARLDGSNNTKTFLKITLPMLTPQLFMLLITITTGSFKVFDSIRIMTNGGPGTSTQVLCMFIYEFAFNRPNSLGLACAGGVMLMLILILITLLDFKSLEKKVHYQ